jgi:hypothetical protein
MPSLSDIATHTLLAALCLLLGATPPAQGTPAQLLQQRNETLAELLQTKPNIARAESAHDKVLLLTCVYGSSPKTADAGKELHFWLGQTPEWLSASVNRGVLQSLVNGAATNCPAVPPTLNSGSAAATSATLASADFKTDQLDPAFRQIYRGDFAGLSFDRSDPKLVALTDGYLIGFWDTCSRASSPDRTQMTRSECTGGYYHAVNGFGVQVGPDICHGWSDVPTGKWADRKLYNAMLALQGQAERSVVKEVLGNVQNSQSLGDMFGNTISTAAGIASLRKQATNLVEQNGCDSPELAHFEQNLLHLMLGGRPVTGSGTGESSAAATTPAYSRDADFQKLLDDAILQASASWLMNKYVPRSVSGVNVTRRDTSGRVEEVAGRYLYRGFGNGTGSVKLSFVDGIPSCLYFWDQPGNCNPVSKTLLADWERGYYY